MASDEQREVNERIATAMGWKRRGMEGTVEFWYQPNGVFYTELPDFYTDPVASHLLADWLKEHGYSVHMTVAAGCGWSVIVYLAANPQDDMAGRGEGCRLSALAEAAGKAMQEAERVK